MARVPKCERLSDVLKRVMTAGVSEDEAKSDISGAIADKEIRGVRLTVAVEPDVFTAHRQMVDKVQGLGSDPRHSADAVECFEGANVKVPDHLTPAEFDWQNSRPLQPWPARPRDGRRDEWRSFSRPALLIELRTDEVQAWIQRTYRSEWERLGAAQTRVAATGINEADAKRNICTAIAKRNVKIQVCVARTVHSGDEFEIPADLTPSDFDWQNSRPLKPWHLKSDEASRRMEVEEWNAASESSRARWRVRTGRLDPLSPAPPLSVDWIELFKDNVTGMLRGGEVARETRQTNVAAITKPARSKSRPATERVQRIISELYPEGVPDQATEPNVNLCRRVGAKLKEAKLPDVSNDTILRTAGRRK
jgi:hypothetical protein